MPLAGRLPVLLVCSSAPAPRPLSKQSYSRCKWQPGMAASKPCLPVTARPIRQRSKTRGAMGICKGVGGKGSFLSCASPPASQASGSSDWGGVPGWHCLSSLPLVGMCGVFASLPQILWKGMSSHLYVMLLCRLSWKVPHHLGYIQIPPSMCHFGLQGPGPPFLLPWLYLLRFSSFPIQQEL